MKNKASTPAQDSPALQFLTLAWENSRHPSHRQKNATMQQALTSATTSGMEFDPADIARIYNRFRASWWIGGNAEGYFSKAIESANTSACIAWETHFQRPALLWQETAAKPERLHVGSLITWKGLNLKVTSFNDATNSLVACSYRRPEKPAGFLDNRDSREKDTSRQGRVIYSHDTDGYRKIIYHQTTPEGHVITHYGPKLHGEWDGEEIETRRLKIGFDELQAERKAADARVRAWVKRIQAAETVAVLRQTSQECSTEHSTTPFRHFDMESFKDSISKRYEAIVKALDAAQRAELEQQAKTQRLEQQKKHLPAWLAGEKVPINFFDVTPHRLRIMGDSVEVTNGNSVPLSEARAALTFAQKHRRKGWQAGAKSIYVGGHRLKEITDKYVTIGCTTLEWTEIDRIAPSLKA